MGNDSLKDPVNASVEQFIADLKRRSIRGSYEIAYQTAILCRTLISQTRWSNAAEIMKRLRETGRRIVAAAPSETGIGNIFRRILFIIREEYRNLPITGDDMDGSDLQVLKTSTLPSGAISPFTGMTSHSSSSPSTPGGSGTGTTTPEPRGSLAQVPQLQDLLSSNVISDDYSKARANLKSNVIQGIHDLLEELDDSAGNIAKQALEHIHVNEVIMTMGKSKTVEEFLKAAARKRKFHVIISESQPSYQGQELAVSLAKEGINTTLITDSAIFAVMSRVNKVIIGTHSVMADGGLMALNGTHALALAAKHHSVPVIVLAAMFKLSPEYLCSYDQNTFNNLVAPSDVLRFKEGDLVGKVHVHNPVFDYVPPDLVTLFISNIGANAPSYVYRLLSECYHPDDYDLQDKSQ